MKRKIIILGIIMTFLSALLAGCKGTNTDLSSSVQPSPPPSNNIQQETPTPPSHTTPPTSTAPHADMVWFPRPHNYKLPYSTYHLLDSTFVDEKHGWYLTYEGDYPKIIYQLYRTEDGGDTWIKMNDLQNLSANNIQVGIAGLSFLDAQTGWILGNVQENNTYKPWIFVTHDGGETWSRQQYPFEISKKAKDPVLFSQNIWFFNEKDGALLINYRGYEFKSLYLYFTHDGGKTWGDGQRADILQGTPPKGASGNITWDFSQRSENGILLQFSVGDKKWKSADFGKTWTEN